MWLKSQVRFLEEGERVIAISYLASRAKIKYVYDLILIMSKCRISDSYLFFHQHITLSAEVGIIRLKLNETVEKFLLNLLDLDIDLIQPEKIKSLLITATFIV